MTLGGDRGSKIKEELQSSWAMRRGEGFMRESRLWGQGVWKYRSALEIDWSFGKGP